MTMEPPRPNEAPGPGRVGEHEALSALADQLTETGLEATLDNKQPALPVVLVLIPGTRVLCEMVLVSDGAFVWDAGQCRIDDVAGAAAGLTRHVQNLAMRFTQSSEQHYWSAKPPRTDKGETWP